MNFFRLAFKPEIKYFGNQIKEVFLREEGLKFIELLNIMEHLRSPEGCPWDRDQTHQSLRQYLLEETYEVLETIDEGNLTDLPEELGDVLLQTVFHAQIAKEENRFTMNDVLSLLIAKLVRRHPHVFGDKKINTAEEQTVHWEKIKKQEGKNSVIDGVPKELSALLRAHRIQSKAATVGFDWEVVDDVWDKVHEELAELKEACQSADLNKIEDEFGDLLFALVNLSRFISVNPEDSLRGTIEKFIRRFKIVETTLNKDGRQIKDYTLTEMDAVWEKVKQQEKRDLNE